MKTIIKSNYAHLNQKQEPCEACLKHPWHYTLYNTSPSHSPYKLCATCLEELINLRLTAKSFLNLKQKHFNEFWIHDDFYDQTTGEALQPNIYL